jgi:hypothetical protein
MSTNDHADKRPPESSAEAPDDVLTDATANLDELDTAALADLIETLEAENQRLRETVSAAERRKHRYTALGFAVLGVVALGGAALFSPVRDVLIALGGTGLFGAVLIYFLTPEQFITASVGEQIYTTLAENEAAIVDDLALQGEPVVLPATGTAAPARLFVPLQPGTMPTVPITSSEPFRADGPTGVSFEPTGAPLYTAVSDTAGTLPTTPAGVATTVGDALVEQFELIKGVEVEIDTDSGVGADRVTMTIDGSTYGSLDRFDHPVVSVGATALAAELDTAVTFDVEEGARAEWRVTYELNATAAASES